MKHRALLLELSGLGCNKWPESQTIKHSLDLMGVIDEVHFDTLIDNLIPLIKECYTSDTNTKRVGFGRYESDKKDADFMYLSHRYGDEDPVGL